MLFHSSLRKELARSFGATLVVLATVVMTMMIIRVLAQASRGNVNPSDVLMLMGYTVLGQLPAILTLSLFIATIGTLSRLYRDSEMIIWFSSGQGLLHFLPPLLRFAWPVILGISVLALLAWPWSHAQIQELKIQYEQRGDVDRVTPGQFQESANGRRVFFIDQEPANHPDISAAQASNIFITAHERGKEIITTAQSAKIENINNTRYALLSNGQRIEKTEGTQNLKISDFVEYGIHTGATPPSSEPSALPVRSRSTFALLQNLTPLDQGELAWRLGLAFAGINFVIIALALARVNPRAGRSGNLVFALFTFVLYYNLLNLGQSWISSGKVNFWAFMLMLHGGVFMLSFLLVMKDHGNWSFRHLAKGVLTQPRTGT